MPFDPYRLSDAHRNITAPPENACVCESDVDLPIYSRALYFAEDGDYTLHLMGGMVVSLANVVGGTFMPVRVRRVVSEGATGSPVVAFW